MRFALRRMMTLAGGSAVFSLLSLRHSPSSRPSLPGSVLSCHARVLALLFCVQPIDPELYNYIQSFNPEETAEKLGDALNIPESCLKNLRIAETLLKEGVAAGLTLFDIAW